MVRRMEPPVRVALAVIAVVLCGASAAQAGMHMHLPKKHHHRADPNADTGPSAPTTDVPPAIWATGNVPH